MHLLTPIVFNKNEHDFEEAKDVDEYLADLVEQTAGVDYIQPLSESSWKEHPEVESLEEALKEAQTTSFDLVIVLPDNIVISWYEEYRSLIFENHDSESLSSFNPGLAGKAHRKVNSRYEDVLKTLIGNPEYSKKMRVYFADMHE